MFLRDSVAVTCCVADPVGVYVPDECVCVCVCMCVYISPHVMSVRPLQGITCVCMCVCVCARTHMHVYSDKLINQTVPNLLCSLLSYKKRMCKLNC